MGEVNQEYLRQDVRKPPEKIERFKDGDWCLLRQEVPYFKERVKRISKYDENLAFYYTTLPNETKWMTTVSFYVQGYNKQICKIFC